MNKMKDLVLAYDENERNHIITYNGRFVGSYDTIDSATEKYRDLCISLIMSGEISWH